MNLVELEISNYRQFHGTHNFMPGEQGMVAIIGPNGAGKTTLFEAIEWCLYNPSSIRNSDLQHRFQGGRPRVRLVLEQPLTGDRYEVEREVKSGTTAASVYKLSEPDRPVVQGTRQVTEYVSKQLIGLPHRAFVATFFTRQKELNFFGSLSAADRRREVGRLLGLETIRIAQETIGKRRIERQNEAKAKRAHYDQESANTDFEAAKLRIAELVSGHRNEVEAAIASAESARLVYEQLRERLSTEQDRERANSELLLRLERKNGEVSSLGQRMSAARTDIDEIEAASRNIENLDPIASQEAALATRVSDHERELERFQRRNSLLDQIEQKAALESRLLQEIVEVDRNVRPVDRPSGLSVGESRPLEIQIDEVMNFVAALDVAGSSDRAQLLEECRSHAIAVTETAERVQTFTDFADRLQREFDELKGGIDPATALTDARKRREQSQEKLTQARTSRSSIVMQRDRLASMRDRLQKGLVGEACPTCGKPISVEDIAALDGQVDQLNAQIRTIEQDERAAKMESESAAELEKQAAERQSKIAELGGRLENGRARIEEEHNLLLVNQERLSASLTVLGLTHPPSDDDIRAAQGHVRELQRAASQMPLIQRLAQDARLLREQQASVQQELKAVGDVDYDPNTHRSDQEQLDRARQARSQIEILQRQVDQRPVVEAEIEICMRQIAIADGELKQIRSDVDVLGFDPAKLEAVLAEEAQARSSRELALATQHRAQSAHQSAEGELRMVERQEAQLQRVRDEASEAQRLADQYDRMYREFTRFEQDVVRRVTPALNDLTSQMVDAITDGKYERIEFTEDFGISVFDGEDQQFPLSQFSGGERDVISLCARLALSQLIGGQAATPLQFVVMDEVFGSLDQVRRQNLMDTLHRLIDDAGIFRQLFVISHVDDVRLSPAFNEIWRVTESMDGVSSLEQVTSTSHPEDF